MSDAQRQRDLARRALPFTFAWGLPILLLCSVNITQHYLPAAPIILMMAGSYAWMGVGCVINAWRCQRLHCYFTGPIFLIGAASILLEGFNVVDLHPVRVMHISYATIALAFLSFVPEWIWGAYARRREASRSDA